MENLIVHLSPPFFAEGEGLVSVIGHADRAGPLYSPIQDARIRGQLRTFRGRAYSAGRAASRYVHLITGANERTMILWGCWMSQRFGQQCVS